jgi:hypothetical protein
MQQLGPEQLIPLSETDCYERCYGWRGSEDAVRVLRAEDSAARVEPSVTAEKIRVAFEAMIDSREPEAA